MLAAGRRRRHDRREQRDPRGPRDRHLRRLRRTPTPASARAWCCAAGSSPAASSRPATCAPATANPVHLTQIWATPTSTTSSSETPSGISGGTTQGSPGLHLHRLEDAGARQPGSRLERRRRRGPLPRLLPAGRGRRRPTRARTRTRAGHTLTLDGQADTDTTRSTPRAAAADARNYVINVLDTGAQDDGVDELAIYGFDSTAERQRARLLAGRQARDRRHLPAARREVHRHREPVRAQPAVPSACTTPTESAPGPPSSRSCTATSTEHRLDGAGDVDSPTQTCSGSTTTRR